MKIRRLGISKRKELWLQLGFCLLLALVYVGITPAQELTEVRTVNSSTVVLKTLREIPNATEACTPEECEWWERLRTAGNALQRKGDKRSTHQFVLLLVEGLEKSYRVPVEDRPPLALHSPPPARVPPGVRIRNGKVELLMEYAAEGSIGEVKLVSGLRPDMDERCIRTLRESIFLPAVKDGRFVTEWQPASCGFHTSRIGR